MIFLKKIRILFNIIIVIGVFFVVGFSFYKIVHKEKNFPQEKKYIGYNTIAIHWEKNNYIVPINNLLLPENFSAIIGDYYYVEQSLETKQHPEKCYFGFLKLQSVKKDHYVFFSSKILDKSNLFTFSQFNSYKIMVNLLKKEEYSKEKRMLNCQNWIKLVNYKNVKSKKLPTNNNVKLRENKNFNIPTQKCINIPEKKYLAIESMNSEHLYLEQDEIYNKIKLCAKILGNSIINFQPIDGSPSFSINSKAILNNKAAKSTKSMVSKKRKNLNEHFLIKKTFPGWR